MYAVTIIERSNLRTIYEPTEAMARAVAKRAENKSGCMAVAIHGATSDYTTGVGLYYLSARTDTENGLPTWVTHSEHPL